MTERKVALVTGANRGIGREIARQLAELGWLVVVSARDGSKAIMTSEEIGKDAIAVELDVSKETSVQQAAAEVARKIGRLDVLINNAGVIGNRSMLDFDLDQINTVMNTNFTGAIRTTKYFMPMLTKSKDARIINISSGMGDHASLHQGGYAAYRLSKSSLNAFTILLSSELKSNMKVVAMCPGWVKTDMGGAGATRSVAKGAETAVWLATAKDVITGKSYRDKQVIAW